MLNILIFINIAIVVIMTAAYFYQMVYMVVGLFARRAKPEPEPETLHKFAACICARNESAVIADLVKSLKEQNYPAQLLDIYVLADNCTDDTAKKAGDAGAIVYERFNQEKVGKGYALDDLFKNIYCRCGGDEYAGFFIFDADNLVDQDFVAEMNKTYSRGYDVITSYRNSKNFGDNWISAGYSIWFLREARFLNFPRSLLGSGCAVSGTGFFVSTKVIEQNNGWPFYLLTEDIQFSANCAVGGLKIGYCDRAVVYDEQPTSFKQSWNQRLRWAKGFYQVDAKYCLPLLRGAMKNKGSRMTCYDMFMTVAPGMLLTIGVLAFNIILGIICVSQPAYITYWVARRATRFLWLFLLNYYGGLFGCGLLTVLSEWKHIKVTTARKLMYLWAFPLFMSTYIPIALVALLTRVEWKPIHHGAERQEPTLATETKS